MKKLKLIFLLCIMIMVPLLVSCDAINSLKCKEKVEQAFPEAIEIILPVGYNYTWIVINSDSTLWFVKTGKIFTAEISSKQEIYDPKRK